MADESSERLPEEIVVPLTEARSAVIELERILEMLVEAGSEELAAIVDHVIGRITRWIWPLLRDLDDEGGRYDE